MYASIDVDECPYTQDDGGRRIIDRTCPYTMADWMRVAVRVFDHYNVKEDANYMGVLVYGDITAPGIGMTPTVPDDETIQVLVDAGCM